MPWRKGIPWGLVLFEGIVLLLFGLYILFAPESAVFIIGELLALLLGISDLVTLVTGLRVRNSGGEAQWAIIQGAVGLSASIILFILIYAGVVPDVQTRRILLSLVYLVFGAIGLYLYFRDRQVGGGRGRLVLELVFILIGAALLVDVLQGGVVSDISLIVTAVLLMAGAALILWAFILRREGKRKEAAESI